MIFIGCFYPKNQKKDIFKKSKTGLSNAADTFQNSMIDGLIANGVNLDVINVLPVGCWPKHYSDLILKTERGFDNRLASSIQVGSINLPFLKQWMRGVSISKILKKYKQSQDVIIYSPQPYFLKPFAKLKVKHNITLVVTDLPEYYNLTQKKESFIRKRLIKSMYRYMSCVNNFVVLTKDMVKALGVENKPSIVMEGIYSQTELGEMEKFSKKTILYTGTLNYKFGISNLLKAFEKIKDDNYRLIICGGGEAEEEIRQKSKEDSRILFKGYVQREEVLKLQKKATVLVNPRQNSDDFVKYSFPSKTMEYLASGTPLIMYKLCGVPDEYDKYIYYVEDNTIESLTRKIKEVCNLSDEERFENGKLAKCFIHNFKNDKVQMKRLLKFIEKQKK